MAPVPKITAFLCLAIILTVPVYAANVYYVNNTSGNDSYPGSQTQPWRTIQKAANTMAAGDTVVVASGTYPERVVVSKSGSSGSMISFTVNGSVECRGFTIKASYIHVQGFTVTSALTSPSEALFGFWVDGTSCLVEDNYVYYNPKGGINLRPTSSSCVIRQNRCHRNGGYGILVRGTNHLIEDNEIWGTVVKHTPTGLTNPDADAINFFGSGHVFRGNNIRDIKYTDAENQGYSPHIDAFQTWDDGSGTTNILFERNFISLPYYQDAYAHGTALMIGGTSYITFRNNIAYCFLGICNSGSNNHDIRIENNNFIGSLSFPSSAAPGGIRLGYSPNSSIRNNIVYDQMGYAIEISGTTSTGLNIGYNCTYNSNGSTPTAGGGAKQTTDLWGVNPQFVNAAGADYHLKSSSPCINSGASISDNTADYDGDSRPAGSAWDRGADEYAAGGTALNASASASPTSGQSPLTVSFTGSASGGTSPYSYRWTFGDGGSSTTQNPSHTYSSVGTYTTTLTVTDSVSTTASRSLTITVTGTTVPLAASASASPTSGQAPLAVSFAGGASGGTSPYSYRWTFGDGASSTSQNPSHTYSSGGNYTATLTVTDSLNATASRSVTITVTSAPSQLVATASANPTAGPSPLTVSFNGSTSGGTSPYSYRWTFGDGASSTSQNPSHTYSSGGSYTATLTVTDSQSATASKSVTITVSSAPSQITANASASPTSGQAPLAVSFTGSASGGTSPYSYSWAFGDGGTSTSQNPSHTYSSDGNYTATLTVTDNSFANASATVNITVADTGTTADLSLAAQTGAPAPSNGGTTDPSPGNHSYSVGSTVSVKSIAYTDYRFSKWTGDIAQSGLFSSASTLTMDRDRSLSATFCTKCADVNGDLKITPADAQAAFDIYLKKIPSPTWCELENADVNNSGTKLEPKVTPADAQMIFNKYLKRGTADSTCSGNSRTTTVATQTAGFINANLTIDNLTLTPNLDVLIPIIIESPTEVTAFGFDLTFPSNALTFLGVETTELTRGYDLLDATVIRPYPSTNQVQVNAGHEGTLVLRVGGYKVNSDQIPTLGVLVTLVFRGTGEFIDPNITSIIATYDDLQNAFVINRMISHQANSQIRENNRQGKNVKRVIPDK